MLDLGKINKLTILRQTSVGMYLGDNEGNDILLPKKYILPEYQIGDQVDVFVYKDHEQRWIATNLTPDFTVNSFAHLRVRQSTEIGAFLLSGIEKDIFVPFREQRTKMIAGEWYVVYVYVDEQTDRIVASTKINKYLQNENLSVTPGDTVELIIYETTPLGFNAIINQQHKGLIYHNEIYDKIQIGDRCRGFIKAIRDDHSIDLSLQPKGKQRLDESATWILEQLQKQKGFLPLHDKSSADDIVRILKMSKKTFKAAVGNLYKQRLIRIEQNGIRLV